MEAYKYIVAVILGVLGIIVCVAGLVLASIKGRGEVNGVIHPEDAREGGEI